MATYKNGSYKNEELLYWKIVKKTKTKQNSRKAQLEARVRDLKAILALD